MLRAGVSESTINAIARRTARLIEMVERATQASGEKQIRDGGAQLVELLSERIEEIRELFASDDEELTERIKGFLIRLKLAEEKVTTWPMPPEVKRAKAERKKAPKARKLPALKTDVKTAA